jgi:hypothetical protein
MSKIGVLEVKNATKLQEGLYMCYGSASNNEFHLKQFFKVELGKLLFYFKLCLL